MKQLRNTQQKQLIMRLLDEHRTHPTADEIFIMARNVNPSISRGTVYRNLGLLCEKGDVRKIVVPHESDHYDANTSPHYHFLCRDCGKVFDVPLQYDHTLDGVDSGLDGAVTEKHFLVFVGLCPDCNVDKN